MAMNLIDLTKRKEFLVVVGIILLAAIVGNKSIYRVQKEKRIKLEAEIKEEKAKNGLISELIMLNKKIALYKKKLPAQKDVSWLMKTTTRLAKDAQIKVVSLQPKKLDKREWYVRIPLELKVESNYHGLGKFLSYIESSPEFINLDSLQFIAISEAKDESFFASLTVSSIYLEE